MYQLSDHQIDLILYDLQQRGIETESLRLNLLDHICILIEENLERDGDFGRCYTTAIRSFYKQELRELEDEARLLLALRKVHILLGRNQFFGLLFVLLMSPFVIADISWMRHMAPGAGWHIPFHIWGSTIVYALYPLLILLVLYLTPDRFDPLIPRRSKVLLGFRPFIRIISTCNTSSQPFPSS